MSNQRSDSIKVVVTGVSQASGAASARVAVPKRADGKNPKYVRVSTNTAGAHVAFGGSTVVAVATDTLVMPADAATFDVSGISDVADGKLYVAVLQDAAAGLVNIVPLEDG
jgi:hypothetical protein